MERAQGSLEPLYHHAKRPGWGFAILAWEGREARRYQFQDGQLRTFKAGYYELLEPVDEPYDSARDIVRDLKSMLRIERARRAPEPTPGTIKRTISFDDQVRIFEAFYPGRFLDEQWTADVRGGEGKRLKRHRVPSIAQAQEALSKDALDALLKAKNHAGVRDALATVLASTDLASSKDTEPLRRATDEHLPELASAIRELLWGEGDYEPRFDAWLDALNKSPGARVSWPLATAPAALVHPSEHVAIKPSVFRDQAQWMAPSMPYESSPSSGLYGRFQRMSAEVARRLEKDGTGPADYLDVYDFVWTTLRPKGRQILEELEANAKKD